MFFVCFTVLIKRIFLPINTGHTGSEVNTPLRLVSKDKGRSLKQKEKTKKYLLLNS